MSITVGASFNVYDGEELLPYSVKSIREQVDYINVVFQDVSNHGNSASSEAKEIIFDLYKNKYIDNLLLFQPDLKLPLASMNEINKRNLGLEDVRKKGLSHFMSLDCDEFYDTVQFNYAKNEIEKNDYDATTTKMYIYFKKSIYRFNTIETHSCPFIYKIEDNKKFILAHNFPVLLDPTRRMPTKNFYEFKEDEIMMHHFSFVRKNIRVKLLNSSSRVNFNHSIDDFVNYFENWKLGNKILDYDMSEKPFEIIEVENKFNISI